MPVPGPSDLVRLALEEPRRARLIGVALRRLPPKEGPAALVLTALDRGDVDLGLAVELLGCIGHRSGYRVAHAALNDDEHPEVAAQAAIAMARILGHDADADLLLVLWRGEERESREGAAVGLVEHATPADASSIVEAARDGRIRVRIGARCVARLPFEAEDWIELLGSGEVRDRKLATEVVYLLLRRGDREAQARLIALGALGRKAVARCVEEDDMLPEKRDLLAAWARDT